MKNTNYVLNIIIKHKWNFVVAIAFLILNSYLVALSPKIIGNIIDYLNSVSYNEAIRQVLFLLGIAISMLLARFIWRMFLVHAIRGIERDLKNKILEQFMKLPMQEVMARKNGELMAHLLQDVTEVRRIMYRVIGLGTRVIFILGFGAYAMLREINFNLAIFSFIPLVAMLGLSMVINKKINKSFHIARNNFTKLSDYVQENTDGVRTTKAYAQEKEEIENFNNVNENYKKSSINLEFYTSLLYRASNVCFGVSYLIAIIYGGNLVIKDMISLGQFVAFNTYIVKFNLPIYWISDILSSLERGRASAKKLNKVLNLKTEIIEEADENIEGDLVIKNLNFKYPNTKEKVLKDINLKIKQGEIIGIIGKLGSGKSTLMNLLLRLFDIENGKIFIGDKDINELSLYSLRENICYITQDNFLFSTAIKDNIGLFRDEYSDEEIEKSSKHSLIYEKIIEMPDEFDTIIGERGIDLSGGQKQRTVIARAFLKKSNIIIFDDTFSALDNKTEQALLTNIKENLEGKTCIIISNRISDVKDLDKIIVLNDGRIEEMGKHDELVNNKNEYYKFYEQQYLRRDIIDEE